MSLLYKCVKYVLVFQNDAQYIDQIGKQNKFKWFDYLINERIQQYLHNYTY